MSLVGRRRLVAVAPRLGGEVQRPLYRAFWFRGFWGQFVSDVGIRLGSGSLLLLLLLSDC